MYDPNAPGGFYIVPVPEDTIQSHLGKLSVHQNKMQKLEYDLADARNQYSAAERTHLPEVLHKMQKGIHINWSLHLHKPSSNSWQPTFYCGLVNLVLISDFW